MTGRGNGLPAASYTPLADLDPQLADAILELLRTEGVAAYVVPAPGERGGYGEVRLPDRPTDRLYVDASARERAGAVVAAHLPQMSAELEAGRRTTREPVTAPDTVDEEVWAAIVAAYEASPAPPEETRPEHDRRVPPDPPAVASTDEAPEEHFVPAPPPPLPTTDPLNRWAWAALLGGPGLFLVAALLGLQLSGWVALLGVAAFVGGFVTLVARMKDRPPTDSGYDDGAVV